MDVESLFSYAFISFSAFMSTSSHGSVYVRRANLPAVHKHFYDWIVKVLLVMFVDFGVTYFSNVNWC